jgi:hypothetical protein
VSNIAAGNASASTGSMAYTLNDAALPVSTDS